MKVLVCGSRDWGDFDSIYRELSSLPGEHEPITVIHGAASRLIRGHEQSADMLANSAASQLGFRVERFPADWSRGKRGGPERNLRMLDQRPDLVLAFQRDGSRGTQHTINEARKRGIPVEVFTA
jgi:hypothetical protein